MANYRVRIVIEKATDVIRHDGHSVEWREHFEASQSFSANPDADDAGLLSIPELRERFESFGEMLEDKAGEVADLVNRFDIFEVRKELTR